MHKIFWRCNGGDYYSDRSCPFDGWSHPELQKLFGMVEEMKKNAEPISISSLRARGFDSHVLDRVIIVEFGSEKAMFDALHPEGFVIDGGIPYRGLRLLSSALGLMHTLPQKDHRFPRRPSQVTGQQARDIRWE